MMVREAVGRRGWRRAGLPAACAAALLFAVPAAAAAQADPAVGPQPGGFGFDASAGVAIPSGELSNVVDAGASLAGGVTYHVDRRFGVWGDVDLQWMAGATDDVGTTFPDMRMLHAALGGELNVFGGYDLRDDPHPQPFITTLRVGIGLTDFSTEETLDGGAPSPVDFDPTELSFQGALAAGWQATPRVKVYVSSTVHMALTDRADTGAYAALSPQVETFDTAWVVPVRAGLRFTTR